MPVKAFEAGSDLAEADDACLIERRLSGKNGLSGCRAKSADEVHDGMHVYRADQIFCEMAMPRRDEATTPENGVEMGADPPMIRLW